MCFCNRKIAQRNQACFSIKIIDFFDIIIYLMPANGYRKKTGT
jgi:hypothetical protein